MVHFACLHGSHSAVSESSGIRPRMYSPSKKPRFTSESCGACKIHHATLRLLFHLRRPAIKALEVHSGGHPEMARPLCVWTVAAATLCYPKIPFIGADRQNQCSSVWPGRLRSSSVPTPLGPAITGISSRVTRLEIPIMEDVLEMFEKHSWPTRDHGD